MRWKKQKLSKIPVLALLPTRNTFFPVQPGFAPLRKHHFHLTLDQQDELDQPPSQEVSEFPAVPDFSRPFLGFRRWNAPAPAQGGSDPGALKCWRSPPPPGWGRLLSNLTRRGQEGGGDGWWVAACPSTETWAQDWVVRASLHVGVGVEVRLAGLTASARAVRRSATRLLPGRGVAWRRR